MAIYDTMNYIKPDVATMCLGQAASMGAFLLAAGAKGKRSAVPNARIMIKPPIYAGGFICYISLLLLSAFFKYIIN